MIHYIVSVPQRPWETEDCGQDLDRAYDICYSLSEQYGYAEVGYYTLRRGYQLVASYGKDKY